MWPPSSPSAPSTSSNNDDLENNGIFEKLEQRIADIEQRRALREPPWDGFCGLVKISDDETFKEQGYVGPPPSESFSVQGKGLSDPGGRRSRDSSAAAGSSSKGAAAAAAEASEEEEEKGGTAGEGAGPSEPSDFPDEFQQFASEAEGGGEEGDGATPLPHDHTARRRIAASFSGAGKTVAASITGASSKISQTLSGGFHAAAEEAAKLKGYLAARGSDRGEEEEGGEEEPEGCGGHEQQRGASGSSPTSSPPQAPAPPGPPSSPPLTARIKTWAGGISHGGGLAGRLNRQLSAVLQHPEHPRLRQPHDEESFAAAAAEEQGDEVRRRRSATAIANEAFKAAAAALEDGRPGEAQELAEVALKGIPDSKPRALKKVQNLRAQAAALLSLGHHSNKQAPPGAPAAAAEGSPSRPYEESDASEGATDGSNNAEDTRQRGKRSSDGAGCGEAKEGVQ